MGVTIHFEGKLKSENDFESVMYKAKNFALTHNMPFSNFSEQHKKLNRVKNEQDCVYEGPTKGIKIQPDENSEPLWLEFDKENYIQEYCKTQFAEIEVHQKIIALLKELQPHFFELHVTDEGEFWETNDKFLLQENFNYYFDAAAKALIENQKLKGPFKFQDGRIIDLLECE